MRITKTIEVRDGVQTVVESRPMTAEEEAHLDAEELIMAFINTPNPTSAQVKYAVRWLVARELGLPAPAIPTDTPQPIR